MEQLSTSYRYIVRTPDVHGGNARVEGTRIGVHDVAAYHLLGNDIEMIRNAFPDLTRAQIYECLAYYEDHRVEIERLALLQITPQAQRGSFSTTTTTTRSPMLFAATGMK